VQRRLPSRVRTAHHVGPPAFQGPRFGRRGAVEDARPIQGLELRDAQAPVGGPRGNDDRPARHLGSVGEGNHQFLARAVQSGGGAHEAEARTEQGRLLEGLVGQPLAADAASEPQVVADKGARARLAAYGCSLDDGGGEAF
jgi:hypothetical protein